MKHLQLPMKVKYETWVWSLVQEDPPGKEMAAHSNALGWRIPWTKEPGGLQSRGSQKVRRDWSDLAPRRIKRSTCKYEEGLWEGFLWWIRILYYGCVISVFYLLYCTIFHKVLPIGKIILSDNCMQIWNYLIIKSLILKSSMSLSSNISIILYLKKN